MKNSRFIASLAIVGIAILGIGGYAYSKSTYLASLKDEPTTTSADKETLNTTVADQNNDDDSDANDDDDKPVKTPAPVTSTTTPVIVDKKSVYKDGTYSAVGSYESPGGRDQLGVSVTLKNDIIIDATVTNIASDRTSKRYEDAFIAGYKTLVIGKNIASLKLDVVSGSSLTPIGFNNAITIIKAQAKA